MSSFLELLDVGIMGHCRYGKSGLCLKAGIECYQNSLYVENPNMKLEDFKNIVNQCKGKTYQFALGGIYVKNDYNWNTGFSKHDF